MRQRRLPIAVAPPAHLQVQGREAFGPRVLLLEWHLQALGARPPPQRGRAAGGRARRGRSRVPDPRGPRAGRRRSSLALLPEAARCLRRPLSLRRGRRCTRPRSRRATPAPPAAMSRRPARSRRVGGSRGSGGAVGHERPVACPVSRPSILPAAPCRPALRRSREARRAPPRRYKPADRPRLCPASSSCSKPDPRLPCSDAGDRSPMINRISSHKVQRCAL